MTEAAAPPTASAYIGGSFTGQLVIGDHNIVISADHGAVVNVTRPDERPRVRPRANRIWNAPRPPAGLLDRDADVAAADAAMREARPVELYGEPGIGKTTLLNALASRAEASVFPDGLVYLSARRQPADDVRQSLFEAFYECDAPYKATDLELRNAMHDRRALAVLDDLDLERDDVEALLDLAPRCAFVTASVRREMWRAEVCERPVTGLPLADAVTLFERELGRAISSDERPAVERLCTALEGHPLRVLQAAAAAREERKPLAGLLPATTVAGQQAQETESLSDSQRRILTALGVIGAPMDAAALAAASQATDVKPELAELERRQLVRTERERYQLAGEARVVNEAIATPVILRALSHYTAFARREPPATVAAEREPIEQTLALAVRAGWTRDALPLARLVEAPLVLAARWGAWGRVLRLELDAAHGVGDRAAEAWTLHQMGSRALCLGDVAAARASLGEALRMREELHDTDGAAVTRHNLELVQVAPPTRHERDGGPRRSPLVRWVLPVVGIVLVGTISIWVWGHGDRSQTQSRTVSVVPTSIEFGTVEIGGSALRRVTISAPGTASATISRVALSDAKSFTSDEACTGSALAAGASCVLTVTFTPSSAGEHSAQLELFTGANERVGIVALHGIALGRAVAHVPQSLFFETQAVGTRTDKSVDVTNRGNAPFTVTNVVLGGGTGTFERDASACLASPIAPGGQCSIRVTFAPTTPGAHEESLVVTYDGAAGSSTIALRGVARDTTRATSDTQAPPAPELRTPTDRQAIACSESAEYVRFAWSPVEDASGVRRYEIRISGGQPRFEKTDTVSQTTRTEVMECTGAFQWSVRAVDGAGNVGAWSTASFSLRAPDRSAPPAPAIRAPQDGSRIACSEREALVSFAWSAVADESGIREYQIQITGPRLDTMATVQATAWTRRMPCAVAFRWGVRAVDGAGNASPWSRASFGLFAQTQPPPLPRLAIERFAAMPDTINAGGTARLCYLTTGASHVRIDPGLGEHPVPGGCVDVVPNATATYNLVAVAADGRQAESSATVVVRSVLGRGLGGRVGRAVAPNLSSSAPATPVYPSPGTTDPRKPQSIYPCRVRLGWRPAPGAPTPAAYAVRLEQRGSRESWQSVALPSGGRTTEPGLELTGRIGEGGTYRWSVQAIDPTGRGSEPTPWYYFACVIG